MCARETHVTRNAMQRSAATHACTHARTHTLTCLLPLQDPVLTDRAFLTRPHAMVRSFAIGGAFSALFIMFFGCIGTYGNMLGTCIDAGFCTFPEASMMASTSVAALKGGKPAAVAATMGEGGFFAMLFIMVTSSISTLDSTFSSFAKLVGPDLFGFWEKGRPLSLDPAKGEVLAKHVTVGRMGIVFISVVGTLPLFWGPIALSATTQSGTVVMGLGAPIIMAAYWPKEKKQVRPLAFFMPVFSGIVLGACYSIEKWNRNTIDLNALVIGDGSYGKLLGVNVTGLLTAFALYWVFADDWCFLAEDKDTDEAAVAVAAEVELPPIKAKDLDVVVEANKEAST